MSAHAVQPESAAEHGTVEALLERALAAYHAHDPEALGALYAEHGVVRIGDLEAHGRSAIIDLWRRWFDAFPDVSTDVERIVIEQSRFWLEWTERGTHVGRLCFDGLEIPARGHSFAWRGVSVYELSGGEIERVDYYVDRLRLADELVGPVAVALSLSRQLTRVKAAARRRLRRRGVR